MSSIDKAVSLTNYFVALPSTSTFLFLLVVLSLMFGVLLSFATNTSILETVLDSLFILAIPSLLTIILGKVFMPKVPARRIAATAFIGTVIYAITYLLAVSLKFVFATAGAEVVFVGSAIVFVLWYMIARIVFVHKWRSLIFAVLQLFVTAIFLMANGFFPIDAGGPFNILFKFYVSSFVLLAGIYLFFLLINAPMKRTFGVASTDAVSMFFSQWFYDKKDIEKAFRKVGETVKTYLSVFVFSRKDGDYSFVVPCVHFGPFGNLGGSNFSYLIADYLEKKHNTKTFVFHGPATHDLNPVSATELKKLTDVCTEVLSVAKPKETTVSCSFSSNEDAIAEVLKFDKDAFIGLSRAPKTTEDISFGMGMTLMATAEQVLSSATIVDQHNAETGDIEYVEPGTKMSYQYLSSLRQALSPSIKPKETKLKVGFAFGVSDIQKIGPAGIKVAIFGTEPMYVIVLIDSNGVTPTFRRKLMNTVETLFHSKNWGNVLVAVYTTDTHIVNTVKGVINPLTDNKTILEQVRALTYNAYEDMQEAKFYYEKRLVDIKVLGAKQAIELISTINAIVAISKVAAPIIIISGIIAILWLMYNI